jgi:hypothetical protein
MALQSPDAWLEPVARTLRSYDEPLLRRVAARLCKPRGQWPVDELIDRCLETLGNPAALDRRLKELEPECRQALALIGHSRQPRWPVGSLVEMLTALGHADGLAPVQALLEAGLLFPVLPEKGRLKHFDIWLGHTTTPFVEAPAAVTQRALKEKLPAISIDTVSLQGQAHEADGLEWPLRMAALWQQLAAAPMRRTQQRDFFKRDLDRLRADNLLGAHPADGLSDLPDPGLFTAALALAASLIEEREGDLCAGVFSPAWSGDIAALVAELLAALPRIVGWNAAAGWQPVNGPGNPYPAANLLALLALAELPEGRWVHPAALDAWMQERHPYWQSRSEKPALSKKASDANAEPAPRRRKATDKSPPAEVTGVTRFLLGAAYPLRLLQACKDADGAWAVRLSSLGRWALGFADAPPRATTFPQTLLVQPNLEMLAYRQGLSPELIVKLTRFATWKTLGAACTLQLEPHSVYRALELGETQSSIVQALERHSMKPTPAPVLEALKTWSNKRERISVYPSAVLLEFPSAAELNEALARGLPGVRLTDRLAAVTSEKQIDYKHFRLTGARDYCLPAEPCASVEADGVTLNIDLARSDLLVESQLQRFAELVDNPATPGRRVYRLTPASLAAARGQGMTLAGLAEWFEQRTGLPLAPAARLLFSSAELPPVELRRQLVLHVATSEIADGLLQWPMTATLIRARLGPTALAVAENDAPRLRARLQEIGVPIVHEDG